MASAILGVQQTTMEPRRGQSSFIADAPRWFIIVVGLAYATGFLVVSTFLNSFGVENATSDLLKLKYLQVGFFFLLSFGSVVVVAVSVKRGIDLRRSFPDHAGAGGETAPAAPKVVKPANEEITNMYPLRIGVWINVLTLIFLVVGFAPPHSARRILPSVTVLLWVALLGGEFIHRLGIKYAEGNKDLHRLIFALRLVLLLGLAVIDWWVISSFWRRLANLFRHDGWLAMAVLIGLFVVLGYLAYRGSQRRPEIPEEQHKMFMWSRVALGLPIYYLFVLSFAHAVYPFMSAAKGGGYYVDSSPVRLIVRQQNGRCPENFDTKESTCTSQSLILLEEHAGAVFVANPLDPARASGDGGVQCWTDSSCRPRVFEVKSSEILYIEHLPAADHAQ